MAVAVDDVIQMTDNSHLLTAALLPIDLVLCSHLKWSKPDTIVRKMRGSLKNILSWIYDQKRTPFKQTHKTTNSC